MSHYPTCDWCGQCARCDPEGDYGVRDEIEWTRMTPDEINDAREWQTKAERQAATQQSLDAAILAAATLKLDEARRLSYWTKQEPANTFVTKDSGERAEYPSGMVRDTDAGKPRFDLCWAEDLAYDEQLMTRWAALMARGAEKYGDRNWQKADSHEELARMRASALRHMYQWFGGDRSEDHAAAVMANLMFAEATAAKLAEDEL